MPPAADRPGPGTASASRCSQGHAPLMLISWDEFFPGFDGEDSKVVGLWRPAHPPKSKPSCARPPMPASARSRTSATRAARSSACRSTRRTRTPPGSSCSGPARKDVMARVCTLRRRRLADAHLVLRAIRACIGHGQGRPGHHAPPRGGRVDDRQRHGLRARHAAWAGFSNNVIPVELGKLLTGQIRRAPQECMDAIKPQADELGRAVPQGLSVKAEAGPPASLIGGSERWISSSASTAAPRRPRRSPGTAQGRAVAEGRAAVPMSDPGRRLVRAERRGLVDARSARRCASCSRQVDPARVAALAISNQRETVGFLDEDGPGAAPGDPVARRARPARHRPVRPPSSAPSGSARSPARRRTRRRPHSACTGCGAASPRTGGARPTTVDVQGYLVLAADRRARRRAGAAPIRTALMDLGEQALQPGDPGAAGARREPALPAGAARHASGRGDAGGGRGHGPAARHAWSSPAAATARRRGSAPPRWAAAAPISISARPPCPASGAAHFATDPAFRTLTSLSRRGLHLRALPAHRLVPHRLDA